MKKARKCEMGSILVAGIEERESMLGRWEEDLQKERKGWK